MKQHSVFRRYLPWLFRALVLWQLTWPAFSKFVVYDMRVENFMQHGVANPEILVPIVGFFESLTTLGVLVGWAGRLVALPTVVIMLVAIYLTGLSDGNMIVLLGCLGVIFLGTGPLSVWDPEPKMLWRRFRRMHHLLPDSQV
jgi:uncharacterized membrane protein YphA (DoxX/SURF4 family)